MKTCFLEGQKEAEAQRFLPTCLRTPNRDHPIIPQLQSLVGSLIFLSQTAKLSITLKLFKGVSFLQARLPFEKVLQVAPPPPPSPEKESRSPVTALAHRKCTGPRQNMCWYMLSSLIFVSVHTTSHSIQRYVTSTTCTTCLKIHTLV